MFPSEDYIQQTIPRSTGRYVRANYLLRFQEALDETVLGNWNGSLDLLIHNRGARGTNLRALLLLLLLLGRRRSFVGIQGLGDLALLVFGDRFWYEFPIAVIGIDRLSTRGYTSLQH